VSRLEITHDRGGQVLGTLDGRPVTLTQLCSIRTGRCRGCQKRYAKEQLVYRIGEDLDEIRATAAHDLPTWHFGCARPPPRCEHEWVADRDDPELDRCLHCGELTMPLGDEG
jgi:hypothetical protein